MCGLRQKAKTPRGEMTDPEREDEEERRKKIFEVLQEGADLIQKLRDHINHLRFHTNCPPHVIAKVQHEILRVAMMP